MAAVRSPVDDHDAEHPIVTSKPRVPTYSYSPAWTVLLRSLERVNGKRTTSSDWPNSEYSHNASFVPCGKVQHSPSPISTRDSLLKARCDTKSGAPQLCLALPWFTQFLYDTKNRVTVMKILVLWSFGYDRYDIDVEEVKWHGHPLHWIRIGRSRLLLHLLIGKVKEASSMIRSYGSS